MSSVDVTDFLNKRVVDVMLHSCIMASLLEFCLVFEELIWKCSGLYDV